VIAAVPCAAAAAQHCGPCTASAAVQTSAAQPRSPFVDAAGLR
jgi:hypothetical protein